jgi:hypothetical protein
MYRVVPVARKIQVHRHHSKILAACCSSPQSPASVWLGWRTFSQLLFSAFFMLVPGQVVSFFFLPGTGTCGVAWNGKTAEDY